MINGVMFLVTRYEQVASQASPRDQQCDVWGLDGVSRRRLKVLNIGFDLLRCKPLVLASSVYLLSQVRITCDMSAVSLLEAREKRYIKPIKNKLKNIHEFQKHTHQGSRERRGDGGGGVRIMCVCVCVCVCVCGIICPD